MLSASPKLPREAQQAFRRRERLLADVYVNPLRDIMQRLLVDIAEAQHRELIAAQPRRHVGGIAQLGVQDIAEGAQHLIAHLMAVFIVDLLEIVQIQKNEAVGFLANAAALGGLLAAAAEGAPVRQAGERVGRAFRRELGIGRLQRGLRLALQSLGVAATPVGSRECRLLSWRRLQRSRCVERSVTAASPRARLAFRSALDCASRSASLVSIARKTCSSAASWLP